MLALAFLLGVVIFCLRERDKPDKADMFQSDTLIQDEKEKDGLLSGISLESMEGNTQIIFFTDSSGKLDVRIKGYKGLSEAADEIFDYLKGRIICPQDVTFKGEWHDELQ
jgi:hypothetical protein